MEQSIFEFILESLPATSKILLIGIVAGSTVYWFMKFYARLGNTETATIQLTEWAHKADNRFNAIELRLTRVEVRLDNLELRIEKLEERVTKLEEKMDTRFDKLEEKLDRKFDIIIEILLRKEKNAA